MSSHYKRGKFTNKLRVQYTWNTALKKVNDKFVKTLIARGIGYRSFALFNDFLTTSKLSQNFVESLRPIYSDSYLDASAEMAQVGNFEFFSCRYLTIRAGHTRDLTVPVHELVSCIVKKKDRKLVIASKNKMLASNLASMVYLYRTPSVYTGRGMRIKHVKILRKAGKKDKQRGKSF